MIYPIADFIEATASAARPPVFMSKTQRRSRASVRTSLESVWTHFSRGVAQPGSAPALGAGGRRFKSYRPDQSIQFVSWTDFEAVT